MKLLSGHLFQWKILKGSFALCLLLMFKTTGLLSSHENADAFACAVGCLKVCLSPENVNVFPLVTYLEVRVKTDNAHPAKTQSVLTRHKVSKH